MTEIHQISYIEEMTQDQLRQAALESIKVQGLLFGELCIQELDRGEMTVQSWESWCDALMHSLAEGLGVRFAGGGPDCCARYDHLKK